MYPISAPDFPPRGDADETAMKPTTLMGSSNSFTAGENNLIQIRKSTLVESSTEEVKAAMTSCSTQPDYNFVSVAHHVAERDSAKAFLDAATNSTDALSALANYGNDDSDDD